MAWVRGGERRADDAAWDARREVRLSAVHAHQLLRTTRHGARAHGHRARTIGHRRNSPATHQWWHSSCQPCTSCKCPMTLHPPPCCTPRCCTPCARRSRTSTRPRTASVRCEWWPLAPWCSTRRTHRSGLTTRPDRRTRSRHTPPLWRLCCPQHSSSPVSTRQSKWRRSGQRRRTCQPSRARCRRTIAAPHRCRSARLDTAFGHH